MLVFSFVLCVLDGFFFCFSGKSGLKGEFCIQNRENSIFFPNSGSKVSAPAAPGEPKLQMFLSVVDIFAGFFFKKNLSITARAAQHFTAGNVGKMDFYGC